MNDKKLLAHACSELAKLPVELLGIDKHKGHICFRLRLPSGVERGVRMSGSPSDHHTAPQAFARDVRRMLHEVYK